MAKITKERFFKEVKKIHGEKYDYSLVDFKNGEDRITIICPTHGKFEQKCKEHLYGSGCRKCHGASCRTKVDDFIEKANLVHDSKYDYSLVKEIVNNFTNIAIICPEHSQFLQTSNSHLSGRGCPVCALDSSAKKRTSNTEKFIKKASLIHDNFYDYSKVDYKGCYEPVEITCPIHGDFWQKAYNHLSDRGCIECGKKKLNESRTSNSLEFIEKAINLYGNKYNYSKVDYKTALKDVIITCPKHGDFRMRPNTHLSGSGCKQCAIENSGFGRSNFIACCKEKLAYFYILECWNELESFIKIGITSQTIEKRYRKDADLPYNYKVLDYIAGIPENVWNLEKAMLRLYNRNRYKPEIRFNGDTECLNISVKENLLKHDF